MEIEDLKTFVEIADGGGISAAARRLGVSKSVVSRQLARLEEALATQLLSRTTRSAALTEAGATFREHAARMIGELETAQEAIAPGGALRGLLRIAAPLSGGPTLVAPVLAELARRHPLLHVHAAYSDRFVDLVAEGFDAAIRVGILPDSGLVARRIRRMLAPPSQDCGPCSGHIWCGRMAELKHPPLQGQNLRKTRKGDKRHWRPS